MSESEENTPCKRLKTSDESMKESICTVSKNEEKLMGKDKVSKLDRLIDPVIASQKEAVTPAADAQSEMKEEKLEASHIKEENHNNTEDSQAISTSSSKNPHLAKDLFCPDLAEEFEDPLCNHETERSFCVKSEEDCTPLDLSRK